MSEMDNTRLSLAEMIAQMLWLNGLITQKERSKINEHSKKRFQPNC